jgi:inositol-polyphosphate multikinase
MNKEEQSKKANETMLKPPEHQVAGHAAGSGKPGPLIDGSGHFYKPLHPGDERGAQEVAFYTSFSSHPQVPSSIRSFFPSFGGTQLLPISDSSDLSLPHLVLEDLLHGYSGPCVMDVKIGARTWYPRVSESDFAKYIQKDRESTTVPLGFRISGLQVFFSNALSLCEFVASLIGAISQTPDMHGISSESYFYRWLHE